MNFFKCSVRTWMMRLLALLIVGTLLTQCIETVRTKIRAAYFVPVSLSARHHLGENFNIPTFYVDGSIGENIGREGESGATCCILLPRRWRPGLSVEVRWEIGDWSHENLEEIRAHNYKSLHSGGIFIAHVPVERYDEAENLWVHFFAGNKVRVVSSPIASWGEGHPIQSSDPHAGDSATAGKPIAAMFSPVEIVEMERRDQDRKKKFGDWR